MKKFLYLFFTAILALTMSCNRNQGYSNGDYSTDNNNANMVEEEVISADDEKHVALKEAITTANEVLPGNIWDGQKLKSISYDDDNDLVEFVIVKAQSYNFSDCEEKGKTNFGQWIVACFAAARHVSSIGEKSGDGDDVLYEKVGNVLTQLENDWVGTKLKIIGRDDEELTILLEETETKEAISEWKDILDFEARNEPIYE